MDGGSAMIEHKERLIKAAQAAAQHAYAPYSDYQVGAALLFVDGAIITGSNVENASYGLTLCAETVAVARAFGEGRRRGLRAVAVVGPDNKGDGKPVTPCGRCRQMLFEMAALGNTDPVIYCVGTKENREINLSELLPHAFGPDHL